MKILIFAGGTGGHILPGLAVADALKTQGDMVEWLGTPQGLENQLVPAAKIPLHHIHVKGIRGKGKLALLTAPFQLLRATWQAMQVIRKLQPDVVVGFGGFVSGPGGMAAWLLHKPLLIHEQNAVPGFTNRFLALLAKKVFQAFPQAFSASRHARATKYITCGNPVRASIAELPTPEIRMQNRQGPLKVLILGGSQGARIFNETLPAAIAALPENLRPEIWHATGKNAAEPTQTAYQSHNISAKVVEFIDDMANAYGWADLVICRAGALTIAELAAAGVASILVPFPHATDDHQTQNAAHLVAANAAVLLPQAQCTPAKIADLLTHFAQNRPLLITMALAARECFAKNAEQKILAGIQEAQTRD